MSMFKKRKKKDETYTRPEGWEKTTKRSYWSEDEDYAGNKYEDEKKKKDKSYKKRSSDFFQKIKDAIK